MKAGAPTSRLVGPKIERTACWSAKLTPKVASRVSKRPPVEEADDEPLDRDADSTRHQEGAGDGDGQRPAEQGPAPFARISSCTR